MKIILGSGSQFRKELMERAGYTFDVIAPEVDERAIRHDDPYKLPLLLAEAKAKNAILKVTEDALLVTSDTIVICKGKVYEKPDTADEMRAFIDEYVAAKHADVVTTVVVTNTKTGKEFSGTDICKVEFSEMPEHVIEDFLKTGDPFSRAGGFSVENEILAPYVKTTLGTRESIMGMPMDLLGALLAKAGDDK